MPAKVKPDGEKKPRGRGKKVENVGSNLIAFMGGSTETRENPLGGAEETKEVEPEVKMNIRSARRGKAAGAPASARTSISSTGSDGNVIIHLPIDMRRLEESELPGYLKYNPDVPDVPNPWEPENNYAVVGETADGVPAESAEVVPERKMEIAEEKKGVAVSHCMWDGQKFTGEAWGIPYKLVNDEYKTYGSFASPEAACAYLFAQKISDTSLWDRYYLLNDMYSRACGKLGSKVKPAAPKEIMRIYGGQYSVEEYRELCLNYRKHVVVNMPPMIPVSIAVTVGNNCFNTEMSTRIVEDTKANAGVGPSGEPKLKREKKIYHGKNTIENCMKVIIS